MGPEKNLYLERFTCLARAIKNAHAENAESSKSNNLVPNPLDIMSELYMLSAQALELVVDYMILGKVDSTKHHKLTDRALADMLELNGLCDAYGSPRMFASICEGCDHADVEKELYAFTSAPMAGEEVSR